MAFNGYNYGGYPAANGYFAPPMPDNLAQLRGAAYPQTFANLPAAQPPAPPQPPANNGILWVQGEEGAKAYMVAPGNTVMLMDSDGSSFYLKSADASGMPQPLRVFDYVERVTAPKTPVAAPQAPMVEYVTRADFDRLAERAEALARELEDIKSRQRKSGGKPAAVREDEENA